MLKTFVHFQQKRQSIFMAYKLKQRKLTLNVTIGVFDIDVIFLIGYTNSIQGKMNMLVFI